ncbi:alpha/beta hydrolase family esterase [Altericroceibacterium endophyticum]|nr:PHB depolymerase family esterase [Altericroceibacterium endophyticum]
MSEILALTKAGDLGGATALIRRSLTGEGDRETGRREPEFAGLALAQPDMPRRTAKPRAQPASPGSMEKYSFKSEHGTLDYWLYVPSTLPVSAPLIIMLHGCTQSAADFAAGTQMNVLAEELGLIVAYPEQSRAANAQKCWNWFRSGDQNKGSGEPALIAGITRAIMAGHPVDHGRIYVAGLSAGGAAASIMAYCYPELYAAAGIHSGLACGSASSMPGAFSAMQGKSTGKSGQNRDYVPIITFHGNRDSTVHPANSDQIHAIWATSPEISALRRVEGEGVSPGGKSYRTTALVDAENRSFAEHWEIEGAGHAWSGGSVTGSYTDNSGPDASREMIRFFLQHRR